MKSALRGFLVVSLLCFGLVRIAAADTCPAGSTNCLETGGVTFTFTGGVSDGGTGFLVNMLITGASTSATDVLLSFALQFGTAEVLGVTGPAGTGSWVVEGQGTPTDQGGCNLAGSANHWCIDGGGIPFPQSGSFLFVIDVAGPNAPTTADLMAFQSPAGIPGISASTGIGGGTPPPVPEPGTIMLLGLGIAGVPLLRKGRRA